MVRLSRYILVLTAVIVGSIALPKLFWTIMEKPVNAPFVMYSCVENAYMIQRPGANITRQDSKGKSYTREEYEKRLPMMYYMQLANSGTMPDSINGVEMEMHTIRKSRSTYRFQPKNMDSPQPGLFPLFESESGRVNLEMPNDFFRIGGQLEFLDTKSNSINKEKSEAFSAALAKRGFNFPAKLIAGLPTTKKSCDEGYLITDAQEQLFHLKMIEGRPFVRKVNLADGLTFKWIECVDFPTRLYYAYLISSKNEVFILMQDSYELKKLPVEGFNPAVDELKIYGDMFHYNVITEGDSYITNITLDTKLNKIDQYSEKWEDRYHRSEGKIFSFLFPFELTLKSELSHFIDFRLNTTAGINWLLLSLLLVVLEVILVIRSGKKVKNHLADLAIIAFTGVIGFVAVSIFPNKHYQ